MDSTEGRYALVAKLMLDRDDWVTPWINVEGVEFAYNGKPPLHFWLIQISFLLFGFQAFAARLPGVLSAIGIGFALFFLARRILNTSAAYIAALVFASSCMTFFLAGAALLDMTLALGTSLACVGFYLARRDSSSKFSNIWGYLTFVGMGIGFMVKGPLSIVLPGIVIVPWMIQQRRATGQWPAQLKALPWFTGPILFLAIVVPWFVLAEIRTPGFLEYFFISENLGRYLKKDYGDLYGRGHRQPFGAAWLMMVPALVPWAIMVLAWLVIRFKTVFSKAAGRTLLADPELLYAFLWTVSCPMLLLGARQYTGTYIVPSLPGFALLAAVLWARFIEPKENERRLALILCRCLMAVVALTVLIASLIGAIWFYTPIWVLVVSWGAAAACVLSLRVKGSGDPSLPKEITRVAVSTGMAYALMALCYNTYLSSHRSTLPVLQLASSFAKPGVELRVGFPRYYPFSANFYGPLFKDPSIKIIHLDDHEIAGSDADILVVRDRNEAEFAVLAPGREKLAEIDQWNLYRGGGNNIK